MKKTISILILTSVLVFSFGAVLVPSYTVADGSLNLNSNPNIDKAPTIDIMDLLKKITDWLFAILLIVAAIWIIIAAYWFVTANGDPEKTKSARDFVLYALIGVLVGFAAKGLVYLVQQIANSAIHY